MAGSANSASTELYTRGRLAASALARARWGVEPTMPITLTPSRRSASVCVTPMKPVPMTPTLTDARAALIGK